MKAIRVVLSPEAKEVYAHLNKEAPSSKIERTIFNAVNNKVELIKANPHYGDPISKKLIPREYVDKYGVTNLFRVELLHAGVKNITLNPGAESDELVNALRDNGINPKLVCSIRLEGLSPDDFPA